MAAILLLNEDAKVIDGILKMERQPAHGINLEDILMFPGIEAGEGQDKAQTFLNGHLNDMVFSELGETV